MPANEKTSKRRTTVKNISDEEKELTPGELKEVKGGNFDGAANGLSQAQQGQSLQNQMNQNTQNPNLSSLKQGGPR